MRTDLKPYTAMKDSGFEWLGEVPEHWDVRRLKGVVDALRPITYGIVQCGEHVADGVPYVRPVDMREDGTVDINKLKRTSKRIADSYRRSEVSGGDIVVSIGPSFGKVMVVPDELTGANLTQGTARIAPGQETSAEFLFWLIRSKAIHHSMAAVATGSTFLALNLEPLGGIRIPLPSLPEQAAIVRYLDHVDRRVRRMVRAKRTLVALLTEQKQAIIHQAVTRGLNPDVPLKDSGVEWLGEVPAHWEVQKLKRLGKVRIGLTYSPNDISDEGGILVLRASNIRNGAIVSADDVYVQKDVPESLFVAIGDVLICVRSGSRSLVGKSALISGESAGVTYGAFMSLLRSSQNDFLIWVLHSNLFPYVMAQFETSTINQLTQSDLKNLDIPVPPAQERSEIVNYLTSATSKIATTITRADREIELLNGYRTRLIADVVTGKLDVREAAAALPEVDSLAADDEPVDALETDTDGDLDEMDAVPEGAEA